MNAEIRATITDANLLRPVVTQPGEGPKRFAALHLAPAERPYSYESVVGLLFPGLDEIEDMAHQILNAVAEARRAEESPAEPEPEAAAP